MIYQLSAVYNHPLIYKVSVATELNWIDFKRESRDYVWSNYKC